MSFKWADYLADEFIDLSPVVDLVSKTNTRLYDDISDGKRAGDWKVQWEEDSLNVQEVQANEGAEFSASDLTLTLAAGHAARVRVGSILRDKAADKNELLVVTAISGNDLTVTRGYSDTSGQTHTLTATFWIVGNPIAEYADPSGDVSKMRANEWNYCQFFERVVEVSKVRQFMKSSVNIGDEFSYQIELRAREIKEEYDRALIHGYRGSFTVGTADYYTMGGIYQFASQSGGNVTITTEALSEGVLNTLNESIDSDELPNRGIASTALINKIMGFDSEKLRWDPQDKRRGFYVVEFLCKKGNVIRLVSDDNMDPGTLVLYNNSDLKRRVLVPWVAELQPNRKFAKETRLITLWSTEIRSAKARMAVHTNLS